MCSGRCAAVQRMTEKRTVLFAPAKFVNDLKDRFYNCVAKSLAIQFYTLRLVMGPDSGTERAISLPQREPSGKFAI
jgi:hypothetical protein